MKKIAKLAMAFMLTMIAGIILGSCKDSEDEPQLDKEKERIILIYAVAANSLQSDLTSDINEIIKVAPNLDLEHNSILLYSVDYSNVCKLQRLEFNKTTGRYAFTILKEFDELPLSTSPERISEVLNYVDVNFKSQKKGLILWSHATGWLPAPYGSTPMGAKRRSFGSDRYPTASSPSYETNINELAEAIPSGVFDFIWFDCCYMANIETVYQLRNKTDYIVGYVEEIASYGMPYDLTMPYLLRNNADLKGAADMVYRYYDTLGYSAPVSIMATSGLTKLAEVSRNIFSAGTAPEKLTSIQNYTRSWLTKDGIYFYDMGQLLQSYKFESEVVAETLNEELAEALSETVVYKVLSDYTWPGPVININHYSGLSMHNFVDNGSEDAAFYKELDWYKATRP